MWHFILMKCGSFCQITTVRCISFETVLLGFTIYQILKFWKHEMNISGKYLNIKGKFRKNYLNKNN